MVKIWKIYVTAGLLKVSPSPLVPQIVHLGSVGEWVGGGRGATKACSFRENCFKFIFAKESFLTIKPAISGGDNSDF